MEKWQEFYTKEELLLLQKIEKENLKVFIEICKKLNIDYFLYGGTLLGAVKYKDIIPWDDDIDVGMVRNDYYKFLKEAPKLLPKEYVLQNPYTNKKTPYPYTKMRRKGTKFVEEVNKNLKIDFGIYIDIYPIDNVPDDDDQRKKQYALVQKWIKLYVFRQNLSYYGKSKGIIKYIKMICKFIYSSCLRILPLKFYTNKIDYYMTKYNGYNTSRKGCFFSPNINNIYLHLYPLEKGKFANMEVNLPGDYNTHLKMRYGIIDSLPPKEKRFGHVPYILDFGEFNNKEENNCEDK